MEYVEIDQEEKVANDHYLSNRSKPEEVEALGVAALVHEAGWSQLPLHLVGKRQSYTATEEKLIRQQDSQLTARRSIGNRRGPVPMPLDNPVNSVFEIDG